ncbi:hypothetical protein CcI49_03145 [Frankia sp. CcI49]|uniref:hypothetical protein n=1 Tax=Frankia sp. CcI49 TaxID=1745382 RepID=UPI000976F633|nr:hypothetical protein [Frankia sp. CcI49]ONH62389.1 hypothetical protein CcI49_03145 [Frankia sp. CcI49]
MDIETNEINDPDAFWGALNLTEGLRGVREFGPNEAGARAHIESTPDARSALLSQGPDDTHWTQSDQFAGGEWIGPVSPLESDAVRDLRAAAAKPRRTTKSRTSRRTPAATR